MENVITDIQAQKRNRNRLNIFLDGQYAFSLDRMAAAWLTVGRQLNVEEVSRLQEKDEFQTALNRALHYLSYRARSNQEMQTYLRQKGFDTGLIDRVIARLIEERLIDDLDFAQAWLDNRERFRPRSQSLMRLELRQKGVAEPEIEQAMQTAALDDFALAMKAGKKLSRRYQLLDKPEYDRKLAAALQRRGFSYAVVRECLPLLWKEKSEP
ncbi:MAG: RecX family transcriptional regulator [Anaerolineaceae bacterium]|nr:RecX family transcriptional regulator [Anaerolineaceae bacterium]